MAEACLFYEFKLLSLACLQNVVGMFDVTKVIGFVVYSYILRV